MPLVHIVCGSRLKSSNIRRCGSIRHIRLGVGVPPLPTITGVASVALILLTFLSCEILGIFRI